MGFLIQKIRVFPIDVIPAKLASEREPESRI